MIVLQYLYNITLLIHGMGIYLKYVQFNLHIDLHAITRAHCKDNTSKMYIYQAKVDTEQTNRKNRTAHVESSP